MKIKSDFVTNSSSTSFVIIDKKYPIDVALIVMETLISTMENNIKKCNLDEYEKKILITPKYKRDFLKEENKYIKKYYNAYRRLEKLKEENYEGNILIPYTSSFETYIYKEVFNFTNIYVDTCNNQDWYDILNGEYYRDLSFECDPNLIFFDVDDGKEKKKT